MEKTAITQAIEELNVVIGLYDKMPNEMDGKFVVNKFHDTLTKLLELEKQQIKDAWNDGCQKGYFGDSEKYYNKTFKN